MRNVIGPFKPNILCKFDLKGSSLNRKTSFEIDLVHNVVMKDLNFDEIEKFLILDKLGIERLRFACMTDAYFLNDMEIMDYSLFVVKLSLNIEVIEEIFGKNFHEIQLSNQLSSEKSIENISVITDEAKIANFNKKEIEHYRKYLYRSLTPNVVYIISIIDYLQIYNFYKYIETNLKMYIKNRPGKIEEISCVPPEIYCTRFIEYIKKITDISDIK
jgi:1-phosphatidylinositol-4-phosphate 5-kinase